MCRPTDRHQNVNARMRLTDDIPEVAPGDVLEIDLLGAGTTRLYSTLRCWPMGSDAAKVVAALELLDVVIERLWLLVQQRTSRASWESWVPLLLRIELVEELVEHSYIPGAIDHAHLVIRALRSLLGAPRDDAGWSSGRWSGSLETLRIVRHGSAAMAHAVESVLLTQETQLGEPRLVPLCEGLRINNLEELTRGLELAARANVEMNEVEIGLVVEGEVAAVVRDRSTVTSEASAEAERVGTAWEPKRLGGSNLTTAGIAGWRTSSIWVWLQWPEVIDRIAELVGREAAGFPMTGLKWTRSR